VPTSQVLVLVVSGPPGVGKSTVGGEISAQLRASRVAHVVLDSDELDRTWPVSSADQQRLCRANLAAFWANAAALGHRRLVLVGVFADPDLDDAWLTAAIPHAVVSRVVLDASDEELERRVRAREIGSGARAQLGRTLAFAGHFRHRHAGAGNVLATDGRDVVDLARRAIDIAGWGRGGARPAPAADGHGLARGLGVAVRDYREEDYSACRSLWVELTGHHRRIYADPSIGGDDPGIAFDNYLTTPERVGSWVAEVGGHVVGLTGLLEHGTCGEVEPVVVTQRLRGAGVGRQLIQRVAEEAVSRGYEYLVVRPVARNTSAIRRFHAAGFATLGGHLDMTMDLAQRRHAWLRGTHLHGLDFSY
jgi:GNAT superfamily N-acetyltransferase